MMKFKIKKVADITDETLYKEYNQWAIGGVTDIWVVVNTSGKEVGYGCMEHINKNEVWLGPSFISEECRGFGLQKRLIRARVRWARRQGYKLVRSLVDAENFYSLNNLVDCGFRATKRTTKFEIRLQLKI